MGLIEEKAKRYDEAIERAKKVLLDCTSEEQKVVEYIYPELCESEDEKIRRFLIKCVEQPMGTDFLGDIKKEDVLAWLEKQGEQPKKHDVCDNCDQQGSCVSPCPMKLVEKHSKQKSAPILDIEIPFGARDSELIEESIAIPKGCYATIEGNRVVIKRGEQKPYVSETMNEKGDFDNDFTRMMEKKQKPAETEELTEFDKVVGVSIGTWNPKTPEQIQSVKTVSKKFLKLAKKQINDEQKPAWSEEDNRILSTLTKYLEEHGGGIDGWECSFLSNWLKSLKDRVQPQSKQEWNDEDEEIIHSLLDIIYECHSYGKCALKLNEYSKLCDWLKSLRPQNRWKPSDNQMASITCAVRKMKESACYDSELVSLFNDLKKLREE